jgi:vacuolar-type H+-ATPase subunit H
MFGAKTATTRSTCGKELSPLKESLTLAETVALVSDLLQQQKQLQSAMELAQRTIADADQLASAVRDKARSDAEAEAANILSRAKADSQRMAEETHSSVLARAEEEAKSLAQHIYQGLMEVVHEGLREAVGTTPATPASRHIYFAGPTSRSSHAGLGRGPGKLAAVADWRGHARKPGSGSDARRGVDTRNPSGDQATKRR